MHDLLDWEGHPARLPAELLGLTDKPWGSYAPGDRWWPSVGCGPVGEWWALWWTQPDEQARRGGMVRSEVALWRLDEVGAVDDLRPVMESLGQGPISLPSTELLGAVAEALISPNAGPPVLRDLDVWPGVIVALWARLWPEARRAFSARVAVSPPQSGESVAPNWIFCVPPERTPQWSGHPLITAAPGKMSLSRAARWLVGEADSSFDEVVAACPSLPGNLGHLGRVARAAERLEHLRKVPEPEQALALLRTLLALGPTPNAAAALKTEGLGALVRGLTDASSALVRSLANIDLACLPEGRTLESALEAWISRRAPALPLDEAVLLLEMLLPDQAKNWWWQAVHTSLSRGLMNPEPRWARAALHWLGLSKAAGVLQTLLPATEEVEQRLLDVTSGVELAKTALQQLREQAAERGWSRLHAWAVMQALSPQEAFRAQRAFPGDPFAGLVLLIEHLPGATIVEEAVTKPDMQLTGLVAQRTARDPELLGPLDASHPAWRALWAAHVRAGGVCWPPGANREALGGGLLDAVLAGDEPDGLVMSLAEGLADTALDHPERAAVWDALSTTGRAELLPRVAEALVRRCEAGCIISTPERELSDAVLLRARQTCPSARVLAALLTWNVQIDEQEAIRWLDGPRRSEWGAVADTMGRAVLVRAWERAAREIYNRCRYITELRPAAEACRELLFPLQRLLLSLAGRPKTAGSLENSLLLVNGVAELGASLAPDRLDDLWERAGGKRKHLNSWGAPDVRWRNAATLAQRGALSGGLAALVRVLRDDFPYNKDLQELETLLIDRR